MKIQQINNEPQVGTKNAPTFKNVVKAPIERIKFATPVDDYVTQMVNEKAKTIYELADAHNMIVTLAQKGKTILINSGIITSVLDISGKTPKVAKNNIVALKNGNDFGKTIIENLIINAFVKQGIPPEQVLNKII